MSKSESKHIVLFTIKRFLKHQSGSERSRAHHAGVTDCVLSVHRIISSDDTIDPETRIKFLEHMSSWHYHNFDTQSSVLDLSAGNTSPSLPQGLSKNYGTESTTKLSSSALSLGQTSTNTFTQLQHVQPAMSTYPNCGTMGQMSNQTVVQRQQLRHRETSFPLRDISNTVSKSHQ